MEEMRDLTGKRIVINCIPVDTRYDDCEKEIEFGEGFTKDEFRQKWTEATDMFRELRERNEERKRNSFCIARNGMKPDILKTASGVTYLGNGKVVKYV